MKRIVISLLFVVVSVFADCSVFVDSLANDSKEIIYISSGNNDKNLYAQDKTFKKTKSGYKMWTYLSDENSYSYEKGYIEFNKDFTRVRVLEHNVYDCDGNLMYKDNKPTSWHVFTEDTMYGYIEKYMKEKGKK